MFALFFADALAGTPAGLPLPDPVAAAAACAGGSGSACLDLAAASAWRLGRAVLDHEPGPADWSGVRAWLHAACLAGEAAACAEAAVPGTADPARSRTGAVRPARRRIERSPLLVRLPGGEAAAGAVVVTSGNALCRPSWTLTDARGAAAIDTDGCSDVSAYGASAWGRLGGWPRKEPATLVLDRALSPIEVRVVAAGRPVAGAEVTLGHGGAPVAHGRTDARGIWRASAPARADLLAIASDGRWGRTSLPPRATGAEIALDHERMLSIEVTDPAGRPVEGVSIVAASPFERTDASGRALVALAPGDRVRLDGYDADLGSLDLSLAADPDGIVRAVLPWRWGIEGLPERASWAWAPGTDLACPAERGSCALEGLSGGAIALWVSEPPEGDAQLVVRAHRIELPEHSAVLALPPAEPPAVAHLRDACGVPLPFVVVELHGATFRSDVSGDVRLPGDLGAQGAREIAAGLRVGAPAACEAQTRAYLQASRADLRALSGAPPWSRVERLRGPLLQTDLGLAVRVEDGLLVTPMRVVRLGAPTLSSGRRSP